MHELMTEALALGAEAGAANGRALEYMLGLPTAEAKEVLVDAIEVGAMEARLTPGAGDMECAFFLVKIGIALGVAAERRTNQIVAGSA